MSLSTKILLGLVLGIGVGVFFGEAVAFLGVVGDAFIQLLQMAVLPYVAASLVTALGRLSYREAASLGRTAGVLLLLLWALAISMVLIMPLAFPSWESASFFSTALVRERPHFDFLGLYLPANPFHSLANNVVPAVVLFSVALGVALMGVEKKNALLESLTSLVEALTRITDFVVSLAPFGVFAIAASAAGTLTLEEFGRLQVYVWTYIGAALLLTLWALPALLTSLTPIRYRDIFGLSRDVLVTAFATGSLFVVLPVLAERGRELLRKYAQSADGSVIDVVVPASFSFPSAGKLLALSFIPFAGWFSGFPLSLAEYPALALSGLLSFFGSTLVAVPFMLDLLRIPQDMFQLFVTIDSVVTNRFGVLLASMHVLVLSVLSACALNGMIVIRWKRLLRYAVLTIGLALATIALVRVILDTALENNYTRDQVLVQMNLLQNPVLAKVITEPPPLPSSPVTIEPGLGKILDRGVLRVCYIRDSLPYAFVNTSGQLVGFDIEMAHGLARELGGVSLEFIRIDLDQMAERLNGGTCDVVMSGVWITPERLGEMIFTKPYLNSTLAFIVKDHRRDDFKSRKAVQSLDAPRIAVLDLPYYTEKLRRYLPDAKLVTLSTPRAFFRWKGEDLDAFLYTAEAGSAWSLLYPSYTIAVPAPDVIEAPMGFAVARGNRELANFLSAWIDLKKADKTIESVFNHWILGKDAEEKQPRWSVIGNVLHWVETR